MIYLSDYEHHILTAAGDNTWEYTEETISDKHFNELEDLHASEIIVITFTEHRPDRHVDITGKTESVTRHIVKYTVTSKGRDALKGWNAEHDAGNILSEYEAKILTRALNSKSVYKHSPFFFNMPGTPVPGALEAQSYFKRMGYAVIKRDTEFDDIRYDITVTDAGRDALARHNERMGLE